jgi:hypothetical protein
MKKITELVTKTEKPEQKAKKNKTQKKEISLLLNLFQMHLNQK